MLSLSPYPTSIQRFNESVDLPSILIDGIKTGNLAKVSTALREGADPNLFYDDDVRIIFTACENGNIGIVCELLRYGANCNAQSLRLCNTPLHIACLNKHYTVISELLKHGAEVNAKNLNCDETPLDYAIASKNLDCCSLLIKHEASIELRHLGRACETGVKSIVELLLNNKANPNLGDRVKPIEKALPYPEVLKLLTEYGAVVNYTTSSGSTPLHEAAADGYVASVTVLLNSGADLHAKDARGLTPKNRADWQIKAVNKASLKTRTVCKRLLKDLEETREILRSKE